MYKIILIHLFVCCAGVIAGEPGEWSWVLGRFRGEVSRYGFDTKGIESIDNLPAPRENAALWELPDGSAWMFGGSQTGSGNSFNDLWRFNTRTKRWAWMGGSQSPNDHGHAGQFGLATDENLPRARNSAVTWTDDNGKLWMFGGKSPSPSSSSIDILGDLWSYNLITNQWTLEGGSLEPNFPGVYTQQGAACNDCKPAARYDGNAWYTGGNVAYMFGGVRLPDVNDPLSGTNDMWQLDLVTKKWIWIKGSIAETGLLLPTYGTQKVSAPDNTPGALAGARSWIESPTSLWLYGGYGPNNSAQTGIVNTTWRFDTVSASWIWEVGDNRLDIYSPSQNNPPNISRGTAVKMSERTIYYFGGNKPYPTNQLWSFDIPTRQWFNRGYFNFPNIPANGLAVDSDTSISPRNLSGLSGWKGQDQKLYLFGGITDGGTSRNDVWKYDTFWGWFSGNYQVDLISSYNEFGVYNQRNFPGKRLNPQWGGYGEKLFLFGGESGEHSINDTWILNIENQQWGWLGGNSNLGSFSIQDWTPQNGYTDVYPGSRSRSAQWIDPSGRLWIFGGYGYGKEIFDRELNDMWRNNFSSYWTKINYEEEAFPYGDYGKKGVETVFNRPGARQGALTWVDKAGKFWMFGGKGYDGSTIGGSYYLGDLWRFNPTNNRWTWVAGPDRVTGSGAHYGTLGRESEQNQPPVRFDSFTWADNDGNLWMYGGRDKLELSGSSYFSDLWKFNTTTGKWVWISGSQLMNSEPIIEGPSTTISPGARANGAVWYHRNGKVYLYGGMALQEDGFISDHIYKDFWSYNSGQNTWTQVPLNVKLNNRFDKLPALYNTKFWSNANGDMYMYGGQGYSVSTSGYYSDLWKFEPPLPAASIDDWQLF